jgi:heme/copper-type cytochrome/quinol oxidase subunit 2
MRYLKRQYAHLDIDDVYEEMFSLSSKGMEIALDLAEKADNMPINYSNILNKDGMLIDVTKLDSGEIIYLNSTLEDLSEFNSLEHIKTLYLGTAPNAKLYYPEPFIASPSFVHNDIGYIHILQYQFWLWFLFVFLICFFFISFICVVRWCSNRVQPRRETRGVSRSKCGDLITATVPVTWAISIIVSESTDATDYYDGFGTGELVVGVRAYQWGWHYYYPKNIDLNYNVKPNYSSFVGKSLKYTSTTSKKLNNNSLWKFYQNKLDDAIISPAHLLVLPSDNSKILNLINFKNVGIDTLQASKAFKQIRASARIYTTNLNHNPSFFSDKYVKINNLFFNEHSLAPTNSFGLKRQHNLTSSSATTSIYSTFLDKKSLDKLMSHNLRYNLNKQGTYLFDKSLDLWSKNSNMKSKISSTNVLKLLIQNNFKQNTRLIRLLSNYPNISKEFGDNSDVKSSKYPIRKVAKRKFWKSLRNRLSNKQQIRNANFFKKNISKANPYFKVHFKNDSYTSKDYTSIYKFTIIDPNYQLLNLYTNLDTNSSSLNLSQGLNSLDSNMTKFNRSSNFYSPYYSYLSQKSNWNDSTSFNKLSSNRPLYKNTSPIISNNPLNSRTNLSGLYSLKVKSYLNNSDSIEKFKLHTNKKLSEAKGFLSSDNSNIELQLRSKKNFSESKLFPKERSGETASLTSIYWNTIFRSTNPDIRLNHLIQDSTLRGSHFLPSFVNYYDYNFNNIQAIKSFEDISWESTYSSYVFGDYLKVYKKYRDMYDPKSYKWSYNNSNLLEQDRDATQSLRFNTNAKVKSPKNLGSFYVNSVQTDDYFLPVHLLSTKDFYELPFMSSALSMDESYRNTKNLTTLILSKSSVPFGVYNTYNYPQSHHAILNNFRCDFEDLSHYQDNSLKLKPIFFKKITGSLEKPIKLQSKNIKFNSLRSNNYGKGSLDLGSDLVEVNPSQLNFSRLSNPISLRKAAKSSIVTHQAFQKVFKLRYEEGRAHVRLTDFANSSISQPYTTEQRIKYEKSLGKTKMKYFNTNYNNAKPLKVFNNLAGLSNSLNFYFFEFPFLDGVTNDPTRHVWFDTFIKYAQREVSGSSVSKYTIAGVPFFKKKFDFNLKKGRQLADTDLYFTRIAVSRKNYVPVWVYTPYLYTRSKVWYNDNKMKLLYSSNIKDLFKLRFNLYQTSWYWSNPTFSKTTSTTFTPSFSHSYKSSHRPYNSIQGYQYSVKTLTDILSKREYLYRQTLERRSKVIELPALLRATPKHPLIKEVKSSFLLIDPITYNSEYSREFYYNSLSYFKFILYKDYILNLNSTLDSLPINLKLVNNYLFFHFLPQTSTNSMGNREEILKSQFKPLKRGITNMMRLQGSGAVAMPIEIRLQILASSKDVIHSWAIPSAGIKIDCIPGYSSHRIMIFFTPGIYWGQCMEICGRYHHWMPIIVYFMKRDMFFLWCTHFLSKKDPYATQYWEANDRQFADYINFVSYNKSSWLTEVAKSL